MISTPLRRLCFRYCTSEENTGLLVLLLLQKSSAESVLLHHDVISDIRRLSTGGMELEWPVGFDLSKHVVVDEDGGCIYIILPLSQCG